MTPKSFIRASIAICLAMASAPAFAHHREKYEPTVFIEPNSDFESYVSLALMKRECPARIVEDKNEADFVISTTDLLRKYSDDVEGSRPSTSGRPEKIARDRFAPAAPGNADASMVTVTGADGEPVKVVHPGSGEGPHHKYVTRQEYPGGPYITEDLGGYSQQYPVYGYGTKPSKPKSDFAVEMRDKFGIVVLAMKVGKYSDDDKNKEKMAKQLSKHLDDFFTNGEKRK